ncbi:DUF4158 domain-containing protein [Streptomyces uncialis]|uniref:DUF4158 domain-containing protein n=1 Tax=Streptomyces uncialis TaxID=1048205 RepID=UPI00364DD6A4
MGTTSIERTAYPRFKRLITARELHVLFTPSEEERAWAEEAADSDEHQLALLLALKSYQRMGCFPKAHDVPEQVVEFVRRAAALPEDTLPVYGSERTAKSQRCGMRYDGPGARAPAEETMRIEAASKNNQRAPAGRSPRRRCRSAAVPCRARARAHGPRTGRRP